MTALPVYTAISFAPVQGFIEKSRKLRDLYGASLILSYLSQKIAETAEEHLGKESVISPGLINLQKGMPNRILVRGELTREIVQKAFLGEWQRILEICRQWVENNIGIPKEEYDWAQRPDQTNLGEWEKWDKYAWEIFIGWGRPDPNDPTKNLIQAAMEDLETRKLKRDWIAINWVGESSSLSGTDTIVWHRLGKPRHPGYPFTEAENAEIKHFYRQLAWVLDDPYQRKNQLAPPGIEIEGKYIAENERLSVPELVKRLVTLPKIAKQIGIDQLEEGFKDIVREAGYWTGWFMGDGDKVGDKLKQLAEQDANDCAQQENKLLLFSELMREWGKEFEQRKDLFSQGKCRVIYAGGDDFMGVLYSEENQAKLRPIDVWDWLQELPQKWEELQHDLKDKLKLDFTYSVGFVWAGHQVPQRDILQHCREAEQRSKSLGRNRVTIRVLFNSGQYVQWTCPWKYKDQEKDKELDALTILTRYRDRDGIQRTKDDSTKIPNWKHIYSDWATLKARHAIQLDKSDSKHKKIAIALFDLYFDQAGTEFETKRLWHHLTGDNSPESIVNWINDLIEVGWHLCRKQ
jgi:CRISPR-associated protein Cmr2